MEKVRIIFREAIRHSVTVSVLSSSHNALVGRLGIGPLCHGLLDEAFLKPYRVRSFGHRPIENQMRFVFEKRLA